MKMRIMTNRAMCCLLCVVTLCGMAAGISDVVVKQRWPWSRLVDIDYVLTDDPSHKSDIVLTVRNGSQTLTLPSASLSGDLRDVGQGQRHIVWDPAVTQYTNDLTQFSVDLALTAVPLYMIVDLTKSEAVSGQITYVYEADLTNGFWGAWVRNPVTNRGEVVQSVIWTGVATNDIYKTDKLVLRRIPAGSLYEGDDTGASPNNVTLKKCLYAGVFEVTQQQWNRVMTGGTGTGKAKDVVSYWEIREDPNGTAISPNWPQSAQVGTNSFMGRLRAMTGINEFDLPTDAQWEYVCKAGTTTVFNDGNAAASQSDERSTYLNVLGWYKNNNPTPPGATQPVGGKAPNAWGLYDTHGNVWEWCLDWYADSSDKGDDPSGPVNGTQRVRRGGSWLNAAPLCRSANRSKDAPSARNQYIGFRLVRTLP